MQLKDTVLDFELVKSYIESRKYLNSPKLRLDPSIEHFVMVNENSGRYQQQRPPPNNERRLLEPIGGVRLQLAAIYYLQMAHEIISTQVFFRIFSYSGLDWMSKTGHYVLGYTLIVIPALLYTVLSAYQWI